MTLVQTLCRFPVFSQIDPSFRQSTVSLSAGADAIDRELIRIALEQITGMAMADEPTPLPELVVEFNPAQVSNYRLLGHATNLDGQLTALYEIKNADRANPGSASQGTDLKYQPADASNDLLTASYGGQASSIDRDQTADWQQASNDLRLTAGAALFASIVESGTTPSREDVQLAGRLLTDVSASSPEIGRLREVISLWSRDAIGER